MLSPIKGRTEVEIVVLRSRWNGWKRIVWRVEELSSAVVRLRLTASEIGIDFPGSITRRGDAKFAICSLAKEMVPSSWRLNGYDMLFGIVSPLSVSVVPLKL